MKNKKLALSIMILVFFISVITVNYFINNYETSYLPLDDDEMVEDNKPVIERPEEYEEPEEDIEPEPKITNVTIAATGDIMFHSPQINAAYQPSSDDYDFKSVFQHVKEYLDEADIAIGNFETVTAGSKNGFSGYPRFNSPKESIEALAYSGFDILSTANNHSIDMGKQGIINTIDNIKSQGLKNVGTYIEPNDDILIENINDINIAFLSYTYGCNGLEGLLSKEELNYMVNIIDEAKIERDINKAKELDVDIITVSMHWGHEYHIEPSQYQIDLANKMIEWGADIILGSHPHVIQPSEIISHNDEDKFVIYSMGNFISNQRRETMTISNRNYTEDGVIVKLHLEKNHEDNKTIIKNVEYVPTWVHRYRIEGRLKYEILPIEKYLNIEENELDKEVISRLKESFNQTISIIGR